MYYPKDDTSRRYNYYHCTSIKLTELETKTEKYKDSKGGIQERTRYYACGSGGTQNVQAVFDDTKEPVNGFEAHKMTYNHLRKEITPEFYEDLKELMGDKIKYTNTSQK